MYFKKAYLDEPEIKWYPETTKLKSIVNGTNPPVIEVSTSSIMVRLEHQTQNNTSDDTSTTSIQMGTQLLTIEENNQGENPAGDRRNNGEGEDCVCETQEEGNQAQSDKSEQQERDRQHFINNNDKAEEEGEDYKIVNDVQLILDVSHQSDDAN